MHSLLPISLEATTPLQLHLCTEQSLSIIRANIVSLTRMLRRIQLQCLWYFNKSSNNPKIFLYHLISVVDHEQ